MAEVDTQKASKIGDRDWHDIRVWWIDHADFAQPGQPPESQIGALPSLDEQLQIPKRQTKLVDENLPGLRQSVLHEGIYLFHKAAHIFGASLVHVESGMCTWSLSSAYQSAYLAMKSILCLLGVAIVPTDSKGEFLVDVWHTPDRPKRRAKEPAVFIYNSGNIEHGQLWACFQRALEKTANYESICDKQLAAGLIGIEPDHFARQRNFLHYRTSVWNCDDLHSCLVQDKFGRVTETGLDSELDDFSLVLACRLVHMGQAMLGQLAESSRPLLNEKSLIDTWLGQPFNRLYRDNANVLAAIAARI